MANEPQSLAVMYRRRFAGTGDYRQRLWRVLCRDWFGRFVPADATVLEMAAGHCEFINSIRAARKTAVDLNPDVRRHAASDVAVIVGPATHIADLPEASQDVIFMSNFLEHLTRDEIVAVLKESHRLLKAGGRIMILQPNIRYVGADYWMFFDHITPVDDRALCEALEINGFQVTHCWPRFLPYTMQGHRPPPLWMVRLYLRCPWAWRVMGKQAFVVAERR